MKKAMSLRRWLLLAGGLLCLGLVVAASQQPNGAKPDAAPAKAAGSRVVKVTLYPNSALVTREVDVPAGDGITELVVPQLPPRVVNSSLYSEGANGLRVLSTRFRSRQVFEDTREDVRKAEDELKK